MREKRLLRDRPQGKGPESADTGRLQQKELEEGSSTICPEPAGADGEGEVGQARLRKRRVSGAGPDRTASGPTATRDL